ncbi:hypothetical protein [Daejeonella oryzae]|uniref:hypothetical protein n=1 Tax=Daejeonella oryzae TaxID=1122943 RepID=UPI00041C7383|nr:hypothetical protein [Daejeonella oryzae]
MKNLLIILLLVYSLAGCKEKEYVDNRPAEQVRFIHTVRDYRDSVNAAEKNDVIRQQLLEKGVLVVKSHIQDSLQLKFNSWEARVLDIGPDPTAPEYIIASFGMNLDSGNLTEKTRYQSLVFTSRTAESDTVYAKIKSLEVGDIIRMDGNFSTLQKTINIDSYNNLSKSKNVLDNPEFRVEMAQVKKLKN